MSAGYLGRLQCLCPYAFPSCSKQPGTPLFQRYARCPWQLNTPSTTLSHTSSLSAFQAGLSGQPQTQAPAYTDEITLSVPAPEPRQSGSSGNGKKKKRNISPASAASSVGSEAKLSETLGKVDLKERETREVEGAMVLDRGVEGGLDGVIGLGPSRMCSFECSAHNARDRADCADFQG